MVTLTRSTDVIIAHGDIADTPGIMIHFTPTIIHHGTIIRMDIVMGLMMAIVMAAIVVTMVIAGVATIAITTVMATVVVMSR
jgi:hypothetical protein